MVIKNIKFYFDIGKLSLDIELSTINEQQYKLIINNL